MTVCKRRMIQEQEKIRQAAIGHDGKLAQYAPCYPNTRKCDSNTSATSGQVRQNSGGEPAALALIDAVVRLLPGVMGNEASAEEESFGVEFGGGLLEYPHFTRPAVWVGHDGLTRTVPEVLVSGHHARVESWRRSEAERTTRQRRPDLWQRYCRHQDGRQDAVQESAVPNEEHEDCGKGVQR